jgi:hypothetical protein
MEDSNEPKQLIKDSQTLREETEWLKKNSKQLIAQAQELAKAEKSKKSVVLKVKRPNFRL